jgi:flavin-dependent dehydrogenase
MNQLSRPDFDVAVVGASCAGLFTAENLARQGMSVCLFERKPAIGSPGRTWIVTDRLREFLGELPADAVVHHTGVMMMRAGDVMSSVPLTPPDLIVDRTKLLRHLERRAKAAGVNIRLGCDLRDLRSDAGMHRLEIVDRAGGTRHFTARHLVGADGIASRVANIFGAKRQVSVPIVQARVRLRDDYDPDVTTVWFDRTRTRFFYWLIPDSTEYGVLGLVPERNSNVREDLESFMIEHAYEPLEYQGAMIPLHQRSRKIEWSVGGSRVLLVGDAAAHVKVTTVGGVVSGLWGASVAANALAGGTSYRAALGGLHRELYVHDLIRWSMDRFDQQAYLHLMRMVNQPLARLLSARNRDSMAGGVLRLLAAQPGLILLGLRSLVVPHRLPPVPDRSRVVTPRLDGQFGGHE